MSKPPSFAAWHPEQCGDDGLKSAIEYRERWGGWVFVSTTLPGYVAWFEPSYTPSKILSHILTQNHNGTLNPQCDAHTRVEDVYEENRRMQTRWDAAHERAYALKLPEVTAAQERFEAGEIEIEEFEQAIVAAEQQLALA